MLCTCKIYKHFLVTILNFELKLLLISENQKNKIKNFFRYKENKILKIHYHNLEEK